MPIPILEYLERLKNDLDSDQDYLVQARWLMGAVLLQVGDRPFTVYFHKGRIIDAEPGAAPTGTEFAVVGSEEAWGRLISGELPFPNALSAGLRLEGNLVRAAGNMHALCLLFNAMPRILKPEAQP